MDPIRLAPMNVTAVQTTTHRLRQFYELAKPRVVSLIVFCAVIGMFLAVPAGGSIRLEVLIAATVGIALVAGAAAAINCLVEQKIDAVMARTRARPLPRRTHLVADAGFRRTRRRRRPLAAPPLVNPLTMWLTLRHLRRLRGRLHRGAEAADAAEHRHRRRLGRHAAGAGLGGDDRARSGPRRCCCS
jgi:hypothetical protein